MAGFTKYFNCPAIESGIIAASVINNADENNSRDLLNPYLELIKQRFGKRKVDNGIHTRLPA